MPASQVSSYHPLPAAYTHHLRALIVQLLPLVKLKPQWADPLLDVVQAIPLPRWADRLAASPLGDLQARPLPEEAVRSMAGFRPYPDIEFELEDQEEYAFETARRAGRRAFPGAFAPVLDDDDEDDSHGGRSPDHIQSSSSEADHEVPLESWPEERTVLVVSYHVVPGEGGEAPHCEWQEGKWALAPSTRGAIEGLSGNSSSSKPDGKSGRVLLGLDRVDPSLPLESYRLVGGTIVISGIPSNQNTSSDGTTMAGTSTLAALVSILPLLIYTRLSNALESSLLLSHAHPLSPPAEKPSLYSNFFKSAPANLPSQLTTTTNGDKPETAADPPTAELHRSLIRSTFGWGRTWNTLLETKIKPFAKGLRSDNRNSGPTSTITIEPPTPTLINSSSLHSGSSTPTLTSTPLLSASSSMLATAVAAADAKPTPPVADRFSKAVASIQSTIFSTSPYVSFPPPPLLVRLRDAEARAAHSPVSSTSPALARQDASSVAEAFTQDLSRSETRGNSSGSGSDTIRSLGQATRLGFRMSAETSAGMKSLMLGNSSLEAFGRHQSISVLYQVLAIPHLATTTPATSSTMAASVVSSASSTRAPSLNPHMSPQLSTSSKLNPVPTPTPPSFSSPSALSSLNLSHNPAATASSSDASQAALRPPCIAPSWQNMPYFASTAASPSLAGLIASIIREEQEGTICAAAGCGRKAGSEHAKVWMHAGVRVKARVGTSREPRRLGESTTEGKASVSDAEGVEMVSLSDIGVEEKKVDGDSEKKKNKKTECWVECVECGATSETQWMSEGAGAFSFAKYLELLCYADRLFPPTLCAHVDATAFSPASTGTPTPLIRYFRQDGVEISLSIDTVEIFDVKLGKLVCTPSILPSKPSTSLGAGIPAELDPRERAQASELEGDMREFYLAVEKRLGALKGHLLPDLPTSRRETTNDSASDSSGPPSSAVPTSYASLHKISLQARHDESMALASLRVCSHGTLNDTRRLFMAAARSLSQRLALWEQHHAEELGQADAASPDASTPPTDFPIPSFMREKGVHVLPGSSVIIREDEPASIIAHTLSHVDYAHEIAKTKHGVAGGVSSVVSQTPTPKKEERDFDFAGGVSHNKKGLPLLPDAARGSSPPSPDPEDNMTCIDEVCSLDVTRPDIVKDLSASFLTLRRKKSDGALSLAGVGGSSSSLAPPDLHSSGALGFGGSRFGSMSKSFASQACVPLSSTEISVAQRSDADAAPPSQGKAAAISILKSHMPKDFLPDLPSSHHDSSAQLSAASSASSSSDALSSLNAAAAPRPSSSYGGFARPLSTFGNFSFSSRSPEIGLDAAATASTSAHLKEDTGVSTTSTIRDVSPSLGSSEPSTPALSSSASRRLSSRGPPPSSTPSSISGTSSSWSSSAKDDSWTSSITSALGGTVSSFLSMGMGSMRGKKDTSPLGGGGVAGGSRTPLSGMGTVEKERVPIEEKPHVQFSFSVGTKLKISCLVYYASAFDYIRKRMGVERAIIESLSSTSRWEPQGGKTKALFFRTTDNKFIVKELVSKWNVSDTHALIDVGVSYLNYVAGSSLSPTALAKILGFYSCKIHNLETRTETKMDLVVMENIFFDQEVDRQFDLKGIEGRRVKSVAPLGPSDVGHDRDWIEGQQKALLLVHPHSKQILKRAIASDVEFLARNEIIDYSLLVGVDIAKKELAVGLVDAIGCWGLAKQFESRAKTLATTANLKGGEVTVIPPEKYGARFEAAMDSYFVSCPDKFTAPKDYDPKDKALHLPSIF